MHCHDTSVHTRVMTTTSNNHIAFGQDTIEKVDALLRSRPADELLNLSYSLTHRMHALEDGQRKAQSCGQYGLAAELASELLDVRAQRDLLSAELLRRCES